MLYSNLTILFGSAIKSLQPSLENTATCNTLKLAHSHKFDWICHLATFILSNVGMKRWSSDKANHLCENGATLKYYSHVLEVKL